MDNDIYDQLSMFDSLQKDVTLTGMCKWEKGKLNEYSIETNYSDVVLLISMLHDYIKMLGESKESLIEHYRERFANIASQFEKAIDYDYQEKLEKCRSGKEEKDDRLGENWLGEIKESKDTKG